jgi:ADP-ribosyl-[dinitrogen reductase] hydrolase
MGGLISRAAATRVPPRRRVPDSHQVLSARIRASLLGGALGDAWGSAYEGRPGPIAAPFPERPRLSDDTWLTVATCEAIVRARGQVAPSIVADSFRAWFEKGRLRGLGSSTLKALRDLAAGAHWALAGARGEYAAGAGAAMRIAPLAFLLDPGAADDRVIVRDVSRITHHSDEAYAGALAVMSAVRLSAAAGFVPEDLLSRVSDELPDTRLRDRLLELLAADETPEVMATRFGASGYVVEAVPLALLVAVHNRASSLGAVIERAVALGGDTDTIASIAGQVVGASGVEVPQGLLQRISRIADVESAVAQFVVQVVGRNTLGW